MKKITLLLIVFFALSHLVKAQVGINTNTPDTSAVLHLESDDRGFLPPTLTSPQMNAIANPADGLMLFNENDSLVEYWNGECWLKAYQRNCDECEFLMTIDNIQGVIDRTTTDSTQAEISIEQTNGSSQISLFLIASLPAGVTVSLDSTVIDSVGTSTLTAYADIFAPPGTYPVAIQAVCDQATKYLTFNIVVEPCIEVDIAANMQDVDLQSDFSLPGIGSPVCVLLNVHSGVSVTSSSTNDYAMTWGALDPQSHVGFLHDGGVYARGGDGSGPGNILSGSFSTPGEDGGDALELTCRTTFQLNGPVYSGGGGGGGVGAELGISLPVIGTLGAAAGSGGGGGAADGAPGTASGAGGPLFFSFVEDGDFGTGGLLGTGGDGGVLYENIPININLSVATLSIVPFIDIQGGDGGDYGADGGNGFGNAGLTIDVSVIIVGSIFNQTIPFTLATAAGGAAGTAIEGNGHQIDNLVVPNINVKGDVNP